MYKHALMFFIFLLMIGCSFTGSDDKKSSSGSAASSAALMEASGSVYTGNDMVKLIKSSSYTYYQRSGTLYDRTFLIRVKNVVYEKKVYIHHELSDGTWKDIEATYLKAADSGYDLFLLENYEYSDAADKLGTQFVVKYVVNGQTYWDNNDNANYTMGTNDGSYLASSVNVYMERAYFYGYAYGYINIRNIGSAKDVTVVYSNDGWETTKTVAASYVGPTYYNSSASVESPNGNNIEMWYFYIPGDETVDNVEFAISYTVDGVSYWDNNWDKNYYYSK